MKNKGQHVCALMAKSNETGLGYRGLEVAEEEQGLVHLKHTHTHTIRTSTHVLYYTAVQL